MRRRLAPALLLAALTAALAVAVAWAAEGELSFKERAPAFSASRASAIAASPDGKSFYVTNDRDLKAFARDAGTGEFTYLETESDGIDDPDDAGGKVDGLYRPRDVVVSPDGKNVYAAAEDDAISVFERDPATGRISFLEFERDEVDDPGDPGGEVLRLGEPEALAISPDGKSLYAVTDDYSEGDSLVAFERDPADGRLSYLETEVDDSKGGSADGLASGQDVAVSPDGASVYTAAFDDDTVGVFERDAETGEVSFVEVEEDGVDDGEGTVDGLNGPESVAVSPDGDFVYAAGRLDSAVAMFKRSAGTSELSFAEVEKNGVDDVSDAGEAVTGLGSPAALVVTADSANVYVAGAGSGAVASFRFNPAQGKIRFVESDAGLPGPEALLATPDGSQVYVAHRDLPGISVLSRQSPESPTLGGLDFLFRSPELAIEEPRGVTISPDGAHLVVSSYENLRSFSRDPSSGSVTGLVDTETNQVDDASDPGGEVEYLEEPKAIAFSPDGQTVYVSDTSSYGINVFDFDPVSGELSYLESELNDLNDPTDPGGEVDGMYEAWDVVVSPDGTGLYSIGNYDDSVVAFDRDPTTGKLSFLQQLTDGVGGVDGLHEARSVAISGDGRNVYVAGDTSDTEAAAFSRNPATNLLTFVEAEHEGEDDPTDTGGTVVGLSSIRDTIVARDGSQVYFSGNDGVMRFERDQVTGRISFGELQAEGVRREGKLELSPDGRQLYLAAEAVPGQLTAFSVGAETGALSLLEVESEGVDDTGDAGAPPEGLDRAEGLAISPDGRYLYVAGFDDDGLAIFEREGAPPAPEPSPEVTPVAPPALAPLADTALSGGVIKAAKKQRQKGRQIVVKLTLKVGEKATGRGWGKVLVGKRAYKLKPLKRSLRAGRAVTLKLKPAKAKQRKQIVAALRRGKKVRAKLSGKIVDRAGNALKRNRGVRLLAPR